MISWCRELLVAGRGGLARGGRAAIASLGRHGVHQGAGVRAHPDGVQLHQVARQGRLGDLDAVLAEQLEQLRLRTHLVAGEQVDDQLVARTLRGGTPGRLGHVPSSGSGGGEACSSQVMTAFWAWRRFSASSQTTL